MRRQRLKNYIKYQSCDLCDFKSPFEKAFNIHRLRVHEGYSCEKCESVFTNASNLNIHILDHINLECKECKFIASTRNQFMNHSKSIHEGIKCKMCDFRFTVFRSLYHHELKHKEHECTICNFVAKVDKDLPVHLRKVHKQCKCKNKDCPKHAHRHDLKCGKCDFEGTKPNLKDYEKKNQYPNSSRENKSLLDKVKALGKRLKSKTFITHKGSN